MRDSRRNGAAVSRSFNRGLWLCGEINVRGPNGRVSLPFKFVLPGSEQDLALLDGEQTYRLRLSFDEASRLAAAATLALTALALLHRRRK